jgi:hypothetical protein
MISTKGIGMKLKSLPPAPHRPPRQGWAQAFAAALPAETEMLLEPIAPSAFDSEEWQWEEESSPGAIQKPETEN